MVIKNGRYVITYNGEIYNYKHIRNELKNKGVNFKTKSDTRGNFEMFSMYSTDSTLNLYQVCLLLQFGIKQINY